MHEHLSRDLFRAIHKGWRNPGDLAVIAMAHLFELCPHCRREFETWRSELGEGVAADEGDFDGALRRVRAPGAANDAGPSAMQGQVARQRRAAETHAKELMALPPEARLDAIRSEKARRSGILLAEVLVEESRRVTPAYPNRGVALANLARLVLHHAPTGDYAFELFIRGTAFLGNAVRVLGDLPRAEQLIGDARYLQRSQPNIDRSSRAELDSLEASLLLGQWRLDEAVKRLMRSLMTYRLDGDAIQTAAVLLQLAKAHRRLRHVSRAFVDVDEAVRTLSEIDEDHDPARRKSLEVMIGPMRAAMYCEIGDYDAALADLDEFDLTAYEDPLLRARSRWTRAEIERDRGRWESAESGFRELRTIFASEEISYDVALIDVDLAKVYRLQGRTRDALLRIEAAEPVLNRLGVTRHMAEVNSLKALLRAG